MSARTLYLYRLTNPRAAAEATQDRIGDYWVASALVAAFDEDEARRIWPLPHVEIRRSQFAAARRRTWARPEALGCECLGTLTSGQAGDVLAADERDATTHTDPILGPAVWLITDREARAQSLATSPELAAQACTDLEEPHVFALPADVSQWPIKPQPVDLATLEISRDA